MALTTSPATYLTIQSAVEIFLHSQTSERIARPANHEVGCYVTAAQLLLLLLLLLELMRLQGLA